MKKLILILTMSFMALLVVTQKTFAVDIPGYPPNIVSWYSYHLYSDYYHMTTGDIEIEPNRTMITILVPDFPEVTTGSSGIAQAIFFFDEYDGLIYQSQEYGRLTGWFSYEIPPGAKSFRYQVLVQGPLSSNFEATWNEFAYVGYGDLIEIYQEIWQSAYDQGLASGYDNGYDNGYDDGYDDGYNDAFNDNNDFWPALWGAVTAPFALFETEIFPGVTFGMIAMIPIVFGLLGFILNIGGGKKQ